MSNIFSLEYVAVFARAIKNAFGLSLPEENKINIHFGTRII